MHKYASWDGEQCFRRKFSFSSHQKEIFHFPGAKNGRLCEATTQWIIQNTTTKFFQNTIQPYMDNFITGGYQTFLSIFNKKDKFLLNREEVGQILTKGTWSDAHDFLQKSFLGSQYAILSKVQCKLSEAWPRAKNLHARCSTKFIDSLKRG